MNLRKKRLAMKWVPYGPSAWLLHFAHKVGDESLAIGRAIVSDLQKNPIPGVIEFVPGLTTMLFELDSKSAAPDQILDTLKERLQSIRPIQPKTFTIKEIPVHYDGPDLARVAQHHHLPVDEVCRLHSMPVYKVYMIGFSPGFPYLGDLNPRLHTPRLASPRIRVPAGSVAIGGEFTGIYTVGTPGGWNIIGHTPLKIFDPDRLATTTEGESAFFLNYGDYVKFVPTANP